MSDSRENGDTPQMGPLWENFPVSPPELDPDGIPYEIMRWRDAEVMTRELARQILARRQSYLKVA